MSRELPSPDQIRKTFGKEAVGFVTDASSLGWKVIFNSTGTSITLVSPVNDKKKIHLSSRNRGGSLHKFYKTLVKFADPAAADFASRLFSGEFADLAPTPETQIDALTMKGIVNLAEAEVMEPEAPKEKYVKKATPSEKAEQRVKKERHIISERPHLMHKSLSSKGGKSYPSKTTVERRWSDGTVDYACAVATCDKTSDSHLSFRGAHWAMHVRKGEAQPFDELEARKTAVDDPSYTEHAWSRKASIRAKRAAELATMLQGINLSKITPEDLAEMILEFLGDSGAGGGVGGEPLTDAQVLDRIRSLVDRGTYAEQEKAITDRDKQIEELLSYAEQREQELETQALNAEQRAAKAEAHLEALRDLINETIGGQEA